MAEHQLPGPVLGVALDGFGLGTDGTAWGGEILVCDWRSFERIGRLRAVRQPGGDLAVRRPARMALAHAHDAGCFDAAVARLGLAYDEPAPSLGGASPRMIEAQLDAGLMAPPTSSVGRLFDALAALTGACGDATYEGEPAILLEQLATDAPPGDHRYAPADLLADDGLLTIDARPVIRSALEDLLAGTVPAVVASAFHHWLGAAVVAACRAAIERTGIVDVCLAGGVWANDLLLGIVCTALGAGGARVHFPRAVPPGDGGLAVGQVLVAHARGAG
jgi:hydrogenase maturation protein HypF